MALRVPPRPPRCPTMMLLLVLAGSMTVSGLNVEAPGLTVDGYARVARTGYPVVEGTRTCEDTDAVREEGWATRTCSGLTAARTSTKYVQVREQEIGASSHCCRITLGVHVHHAVWPLVV